MAFRFGEQSLVPIEKFIGARADAIETAARTATPEASASATSLSNTTVRRRRSYAHLADRVFGRTLCITQQKLDVIMSVIGPRLGVSNAPPLAYWDDEDDYEDEPDKPDYWKFQDGVATVPIHGTLVKRNSGFSGWSGMASYESLKTKVAQAIADPEVKALVLDIDSPGGESDGMFELADYLFSVRGQKPIVAVCDGQMCSAAYALGSAADSIYITQTGMIGSVGCYMLHVDQSGADELDGVKYTYIQAGAKKTEGNPHEPLSGDARATMQTEVDRIRSMFVSLVARNRNVTADAVAGTEAGIAFGPAGVPLFADKIGTWDDAMADMFAKIATNQPGDKEGIPPDDSMKLAAADITPALAANAIATISTVNWAPGPFTTSLRCAWPPGSTATVHTPLSVGSGLVTAQPLSPIVWAAFPSLSGGGKSDMPCTECGGTGICGNCDGTGMDGDEKCAECDGTGKCAACDGTGKMEKTAALKDSPFAHSQNSSHRAMRALVAYAPEIKRKLRAHAIPRIVSLMGSRSEIPGSDRTIDMLVVPYDNSLSINLGGFRETYQRGCFADGLDNDPRALFNHDEACVLGRKSAGTATFWEDAEGVHVRATAPETTWANDLLVSMRRGDISQASAAFWIVQQRWEVRGGEKVRVVEKGLLRDASVLAYAAYETTTATAEPAAAVTQRPDINHSNELRRRQLALLRLR